MPRAGQQYEVNDAIRRKISEAMDAIPMTRADLAKEIGAGRNTVTDFFEKKQTHSTYLPAILEAVGLPPPEKLDLTDDELAMLRVFRELTPRDRQKVLADAAALLSRRKSNPNTAIRDTEIGQALDAAVKQAEDQTDTVQSFSEGSPRDPRTRRAPRSR